MSDASKPPGERRSYDSFTETRDLGSAVAGNVRSPTAYSPTLAGSGPQQPSSGQLDDEALQSARDEKLVGQLVGNRYRIISRIGRGGMSVVYEAHDVTLNRRVAFKIMDLAQLPDDVREQRSLSEARSQGKSSHPNVVAVFDVGTMPEGLFAGRPFIVMEFVEGVNLDKFIQSPEILQLPLAEAASIMEQILEALEVAHASEIVHRDLKPDNVFLQIGERRGRRTYSAKVGDFGLAKQGDRSSGTVGIVGTPLYMSPEQANNVPLDIRSDLYAAGLIAYELMTGGHYAYEYYLGRITDPVTGRYSAALAMSAHIIEPMMDPRQFRPDLPEAVVVFLGTALAKNRDQRFQTAGEMLEAIEAIADVRRNLTPSIPGTGDVQPVIPLTRFKTPDQALPPAPLPVPKLSGAARRPMRFVAGALLAIALAVAYVGYRAVSQDSQPNAAPRTRVDRPIVSPASTPAPSAPDPAATPPPARTKVAVPALRAVSPAPTGATASELQQRIEKLREVCGPELKRRRLTRAELASCREYAKLQREYAKALRGGN